jgi:hypothetical protein
VIFSKRLHIFDHNVQDHGPKRLKNHGHGMFTVRSRSRSKNERNTVIKLLHATLRTRFTEIRYNKENLRVNLKKKKHFGPK